MEMMNLRYYKFEDFDEIEEVGSGGYGTIYSAKFKLNRYPLKGRVALKRFKSSEQMPEIFISEVCNLRVCVLLVVRVVFNAGCGRYSYITLTLLYVFS